MIVRDNSRMALELDNWRTLDQAAGDLNCSRRQVEKLIERGQLTTTKRHQQGRKAVTVVDPGDIERYKNRTVPIKPAIVPPDTEVVEVPMRISESGGSVGASLGRDIAAAIAERFEQMIPKLFPAPAADAEVVPIADKVLVTMKEAAALGFNREKLAALAKEGKLENVGTPHRYRFRRRDLDAL